jgi:[CysO sulfur-carrier protein]-S-L-cysteine hydrolase
VHRRRYGYRDDYRGMALTIAQQVVDGVIAHARDDAPLECCGLLIGAGHLIDEYVRTRNLRASEVAYEVDAGEHIAIRRKARPRGRSVVGAYHSHPKSAAVPSPTDVAEAHYEDEFVYLIVSLQSEPPDVRAYRLAGGALIEAPFQLLA